MRRIILIALIFSLSASTIAQVTKTYKVSAGDDISAALSIYGVYRFPSFIYGLVLFKDGTTTNAKMNFNVFLNDMQFIDNKGDTLAINHAELIDSIKLDSTVYYFDKGYCEIILDNSGVKLIAKEKVNYEIMKKGAYDLPSRGGSIETYGVSDVNYNPAKKITLNEDIIIKKETTYFVSAKKFRVYKADKRGFLNAFPDQKKEITEFADSSKINFDNEDDLKKLLQFCKTHL
ncbi:MAG: hypothetical protein QM764_10230 [Chitinophagaceae bacterium]